MPTQIPDAHLSQIQTRWSEILKANDCHGSQASRLEAQRRILMRYGLPIQRYLLAATHDIQAAEDLAQDFAYRFCRGDLKNASPARGRFRDYLKTVLRNSVNDYFRKRKKENWDPLLEPYAHQPVESLDESFNEDWRQEILRRTWRQLENFAAEKQNHYFALLRLRAQQPEINSEQMATRLSDQLRQPFTAASIRQMLKRARSKFCQLLLAEVTNTLSHCATPDDVQAELADLRLLKYTVNSDA